MSSAHVAEKVRARLAAAGTGLTIVSDTWLFNDEPAPDDVDYWLAADFPGGIEEQITVGAPGNNVFRESGAFQVHVFAKAGKGDTQLRTYAEAVREAFRASTFDGIRCYGADPAQIGDGDLRGRWLRATVAVEYEYDIYA
ncbi:MAG: phage tail terminator-like protein [Alphaproteobacteria bacterium]